MDFSIITDLIVKLLPVLVMIGVYEKISKKL